MPDARILTKLACAVAAFVAAAPALAQGKDSLTAPVNPPCPDCAAWNKPHAPVRLFGNAWYVGTDGLGAILITSNAGHILIDGALPESAPLIAANIEAAGFRLDDVELILNSHVHYDHAGGIAELARMTGARIAASPASAVVLERGLSGRDDPQYGILPAIAAVRNVRRVQDGEVLRVGALAVTAHFTPGHTPGGTTWSWESCEGSTEKATCRAMVYADSQTPISADGFRYTDSATYPSAVGDFERGHATLERLRCEILVTPHPSATALWERIAKRDAGERDALVDAMACSRYAAASRERLAKRLAQERAAR